MIVSAFQFSARACFSPAEIAGAIDNHSSTEPVRRGGWLLFWIAVLCGKDSLHATLIRIGHILLQQELHTIRQKTTCNPAMR
jgi:hypothetical protein